MMMMMMMQSQHPDAKERERQAKRLSNKETTEELYNQPNEHQPNQIKPTDLISQSPQCLHPCHWMIPEACGDLTCQWLPRWLDRPPVLGPRWPAFSLPHIHSSRFHNLVTTLLPFVGPWEVESTIAFYSEMFQISPTKERPSSKPPKISDLTICWLPGTSDWASCWPPLKPSPLCTRFPTSIDRVVEYLRMSKDVDDVSLNGTIE